MPRQKKVAPVKERKPRQKRQPKKLAGGTITETNYIDELLRKELLCFTSGNAPVEERIADAKKLYDYIKGKDLPAPYYADINSPKSVFSQMNATPIPSPVVMSSFPLAEDEPDPVRATHEHVRSKFDQLSM